MRLFLRKGGNQNKLEPPGLRTTPLRKKRQNVLVIP